MDQDITIYLAKAEESLRTAESEFANSRYNSCANRCYYACFQAAIAALLAEGIRARGGCDRAIPNPNLLIKSFACKIKYLLKNIVLLYSPGSYVNTLDAGP